MTPPEKVFAGALTPFIDWEESGSKLADAFTAIADDRTLTFRLTVHDTQGMAADYSLKAPDPKDAGDLETEALDANCAPPGKFNWIRRGMAKTAAGEEEPCEYLEVEIPARLEEPCMEFFSSAGFAC